MINHQKKVEEYQRKFGYDSARSATFIRPKDVVPTGILALDYALGTGGWPVSSIIEVFGPPDVGKSLLALYGCREAQKRDMFCGWIATEPGYDEVWAKKHGVDPTGVIITNPDDGEQAFNILQEMVLDDDIKFIVFDSLGQVTRASEMKEGSAPPAAGAAALITFGVRRSWMASFKKGKYIIFLNQVRDVMSSRFPVLDSPGGHFVKHASEIRIQLRPGEKFDIKDGDNKITIGREVIAEIKRSKRDEGTGKRAVWNMYTMETEDNPFGIDTAYDVINTGKRTGIIEQGGAWYQYDRFPNGKLQGKSAIAEWLVANPEEFDIIQQKIVETIR